MKQNGFTLVEMLVVILVFTTISAIVIAILTTTFQGNNKTNALNLIQQNGNYAMTQVVKSIRNASTLIAPYPCGTVSSPTATSSVSLRFPDGSTSTFSCNDSLGHTTLASNGAALIDTSSVTVSSCSFTCGQATINGTVSPSSNPIIGVTFSLQSKNSNGFADLQASASAIQFQTSVVLRNLLR